MQSLNLPAKLEHLPQMLDFIEAGAQAQRFDDKKINQVRLAAEEVLVNVINYAYPEQGGDIEIMLMPKAQGLQVTVAGYKIRLQDARCRIRRIAATCNLSLRMNLP